MQKKELQDTVVLVKKFLSSMEDRNLILAKSFLGENFKLVFPGNQTFSTIEEVTFWAKNRYHWVKKNYNHFDSLTTNNIVIVYCYGTLYGESLDGTKFSEIRFIDRFTLKEKILEQLVWNDLAEYK